jgi:hypothetical protein
MSTDRFSDEQLEAAIGALLDPERFRAAEDRIARVVPQLQQVLASVLAEGGWFESREGPVSGAAGTDDVEERANAIRMLLAEEARVAMLVGVAIGWELARRLELPRDELDEGDSIG